MKEHTIAVFLKRTEIPDRENKSGTKIENTESNKHETESGEICENTFNNNIYFKQHMKFVHKVKEFAYDLCQYRF